MFKFTFFRKNTNIEEIENNHAKKIQLMKSNSQLKVTEIKTKNEVELNKIKTEEDQLKINERIRQLKITVLQDKAIVRAGKLIDFWGTLATIISTCLTIAGLYELFIGNTFKLISFVSAIIMIQFTVFLLSKQDTNVKKHFRQHASKAIFLKYMLLGISVYGNYTFFSGKNHNGNMINMITTLVLCISIDFISIFAIAIAQDFKMLNKNSSENLYKGILSKIFFNFSYKFIMRIENLYQENIKISQGNSQGSKIISQGSQGNKKNRKVDLEKSQGNSQGNLVFSQGIRKVSQGNHEISQDDSQGIRKVDSQGSQGNIEISQGNKKVFEENTDISNNPAKGTATLDMTTLDDARYTHFVSNNLEKFNKPSCENEFLNMINTLRNSQGYIEKTNSDLENMFNLTSYELRKFKDELKSQGKIIIENKKIKVLNLENSQGNVEISQGNK
jgi:hypothetical protein